jgi:ribosomal-protein-serine acetyltransferase
MNTLLTDLQFRFFESGDAEALFDMIAQNRAHLRQWLYWVDGIKDISSVKAYLQLVQHYLDEQKGVAYAVMHEGQIIGQIDIHHFNREIGSAQIGYWIAKGYEGRGFMKQACRWMIAKGFTDYNLNRIEINFVKENQRSANLAQSLGFTYEGTLRQAYRLHGQLWDLTVMSQLKQEWIKEQTGAVVSL